jgi:hypothetical protein
MMKPYTLMEYGHDPLKLIKPSALGNLFCFAMDMTMYNLDDSLQPPGARLGLIFIAFNSSLLS